MIRAQFVSVLAALALAAASDTRAAAQEAAQEPSPPVQISDVKALVAEIEKREREVSSAVLEMQTKGRFPGGVAFTTSGTLRVLGKTHFHTEMTSRFGPPDEEMEAQFATVKTPDGVWMRERDPAQGEIYVRMTPELVARLESASAFLGGVEVPGVGGHSSGPLGSVMLADLEKQFELTVSGPRELDGEQVWLVEGPRRAGVSAEGPDDGFGALADRVEMRVRCSDTAVVRMTQLRQGRPILEVSITKLVLDSPLAPESFAIEIPEGTRVIDAMDHPPAQAQIERILEEARAKGWTEGEAPAPAPEAPTKSGEAEGAKR
jgi:hypothetical protein